PASSSGAANRRIARGHRSALPVVSRGNWVCRNGRARTALSLVVDPADRAGDLADLGHPEETEMNFGLHVRVSIPRDFDHSRSHPSPRAGRVSRWMSVYRIAS